MSDKSLNDPRPLSPHLQVYRPMLTMMMSITHRITGVGLYLGALLVAWWLVSAAVGGDYFALVNGFFGSWFGRLILLGYTWALIHHALGGLRQPDTAGLTVTGILPGFAFEFDKKVETVYGEPGQVHARPQRPDDAGGVPAAAAGQLFALEQQYVVQAEAAEMAGDTETDRTAADDDDPAMLVSHDHCPPCNQG